MQALILQRFWSRWRQEYFNLLVPLSPNNRIQKQVIQKGNVVLVHDDGPRATWRLAIFDNLSEGNDDLAHAASIGTSTGYKNRASAEHFPLEVS